MIKLPALLASLSLAFVVVNANVVELGKDDFDSKMEGFDMALVMFYAPWCGHCKRLKPEFAKAGVDLLNIDNPVQLVQVDCTAEGGEDLCLRFEVRGYPTLKIFKAGELSGDYNGPREAGGIVKYMKSRAGPASRELDTENAFKSYLDKAEEVVVAGVFEKKEDLVHFLRTAEEMREDVTFIHSTKSGKVRKAGVHLHRPKRLQSKLEKAEVKFEGSLEDGSLSNWIRDSYHGLVGHRTPDNAQKFPPPLVVAYYDVDYKKNAKGTNYWRNRIMKVAKQFRDLNFAISNKDDFQHELSDFGWGHVSGDKPMVAVKDAEGTKYRMEGVFDPESFAQFIKQYQDGHVRSYVRSEPVPEKNDAGVKIAVGMNFEELVTTSTKDVLVEFYAPWCGHCKQLAPIYDELGEKMKGENVEIVKMDATANDVPPEFEVKGFPTIMWIKNGASPVAYNGGRKLEDFINYIAQHATEELKGFDRNGKAKKSEL